MISRSGRTLKLRSFVLYIVVLDVKVGLDFLRRRRVVFSWRCLEMNFHFARHVCHLSDTGAFVIALILVTVVRRNAQHIDITMDITMENRDRSSPCLRLPVESKYRSRGIVIVSVPQMEDYNLKYDIIALSALSRQTDRRTLPVISRRYPGIPAPATSCARA